MRLFIALNLDPSVREAVLSAQSELKGRSGSGNFSSPENLHLTLAFLGEVDSLRKKDLLDLLESLPVLPLSLVLTGMGVFPRGGEGLYWIGMEPSPALLALAERIRSALAQSGFSFDRKPFSPHLTLGREVVLRPEWAGRPLPAFPSRIFVPDRISLMESLRENGRLVYREIGRRPLNEKPSPIPPKKVAF